MICKPDAVERGLVGEIVGRMEARGLRLVAGEVRRIDVETAERHYDEHRREDFFAGLVAYISRSPVFVAVVEGPPGTWRMVRTMVGPTNPADAAPGTIRGDLALTTRENLVHASDGPGSASREIGLFFPSLAGPPAGAPEPGDLA